MNRRVHDVIQLVTLLCLLLGATVPTHPQSPAAFTDSPQMYKEWMTRKATDAALVHEVAAPLLSPELALATYERRIVRQSDTLSSYNASTVVQANLPDALQQGEFELRTQYIAPRTLRFKAVRFMGDHFVKSEVISRVLQSEVRHVENSNVTDMSISSNNYSFKYKKTEPIGPRIVHVFAVKPRQKRSGLFKGDIYLDANTGSLCQAKGRMVKSPSFFIRRIEFAQEYADFEGFTVPVHLHSVADTRLVGHVVVDIFVYDYSLMAKDTPDR
jgi:hypothetical protein